MLQANWLTVHQERKRALANLETVAIRRLGERIVQDKTHMTRAVMQERDGMQAAYMTGSIEALGLAQDVIRQVVKELSEPS